MRHIITEKTVPAVAGPATTRAACGEYLTDLEAAGILAVEPRTLRLWRATRGLPFIRITSKVIRYRRSDIEQWLDRRRVAIAA